MNRKTLENFIAGGIVGAVLATAGMLYLTRETPEIAEYCAAVAAAAHQDDRGVCPAGTYGSFTGLPGDVACHTDSECEGV